jgi:UDP-N-acetylmuramoylalanine--D-glutamate ligase
MSQARAALADLDILWALGGHPVSLLDACDLCASPAAFDDLPIVQEARRRGIPLTNDAQIFMENAVCQTIGITGSAGKTTTTSLVGSMARFARGIEAAQGSGVDVQNQNRGRGAQAGQVFVGGNIGDPLINHLDTMRTDDLAILELSSNCSTWTCPHIAPF